MSGARSRQAAEGRSIGRTVNSTSLPNRNTVMTTG
jgi:hypothetical protein